jgi:uncharacterized membrane protein
MSTLAVFDFDGIRPAEVSNKLRSLPKEYLIDREDACVVERGPDGKVDIKQAVNPDGAWAVSGGKLARDARLFVGFLFLNPVAGMAVGAITDAGCLLTAGGANTAAARLAGRPASCLRRGLASAQDYLRDYSTQS